MPQKKENKREKEMKKGRKKNTNKKRFLPKKRAQCSHSRVGIKSKENLKL